MTPVNTHKICFPNTYLGTPVLNVFYPFQFNVHICKAKSNIVQCAAPDKRGVIFFLYFSTKTYDTRKKHNSAVLPRSTTYVLIEK